MDLCPYVCSMYGNVNAVYALSLDSMGMFGKQHLNTYILRRWKKIIKILHRVYQYRIECEWDLFLMCLCIHRNDFSGHLFNSHFPHSRFNNYKGIWFIYSLITIWYFLSLPLFLVLSFVCLAVFISNNNCVWSISFAMLRANRHLLVISSIVLLWTPSDSEMINFL